VFLFECELQHYTLYVKSSAKFYMHARSFGLLKKQVAKSLQDAMLSDGPMLMSLVENTRVVWLLVYFSCFAIVVVDIILAHYFDVVRHILVPTEKLTGTCFSRLMSNMGALKLCVIENKGTFSYSMLHQGHYRSRTHSTFTKLR
jgi:hypothetical protein